MATVGKMIGPIVDGVVSKIDVDDIVERIDVDHLMERIDIDKLINRIDFDKVLEKIDIEKVLDRIDMNKVLTKVDVNELVERAELGAIIARSTNGVFSPIIDGARAQIIFMDQVIQGQSKYLCRGDHLPGSPVLDDIYANIHIPMPKGAANIAVAVQKRYAGTFSRGMAFVLDQAIISTTFFIVVWFIENAISLIQAKKNDDDPYSIEDGRNGKWVTLGVYLLWEFIYYTSALAASGRTIGKAILGLQVVNQKDGIIVNPMRAAIRTILLPFNVWSIIGVVFGIIRSDRRELHDLLCGTAVIYSWDARMARYREQSIEDSQPIYIPSVSIIEQQMTQEESARSTRHLYGLFHRKKAPPPTPSVRNSQPKNI